MDELKNIFDKFSNGLKHYTVMYNGTIYSVRSISVHEISIDKNGCVRAKWYENEYNPPTWACVNEICTLENDYVTGLFLSEEMAVNAAKNEYKRQLNDKHADLLKKLNDVENKLKRL